MAARKASDDRPAPPIVRYAPLGELKVYEISEAELEKLEDGPPGYPIWSPYHAFDAAGALLKALGEAAGE